MSELQVKTMSQFMAEGKEVDILFWVGSAGSFDDRAKKITKAFVQIMNKAEINFGVLGTEESSSGDAAKRAGNEFLFQMQALTNIETLNSYNVKKIVTACPHCFNTIKNEYPGLGGSYDVVHHTQLLDELISNGKIKISNDFFKGKKITFHDPCYLGRANKEYKAPRNLIKSIKADLKEMKSCKEKGLIVGQGTGDVKEHLDLLKKSNTKIYVSGMSAKARGYDDTILEGYNAEFAMPDTLIKLSLEADSFLSY